ncbi:biotin/lipoyl-binding protein [Pectobacteriaceae bacterium CE70]|nr:HlyD family efflux transporter periplasmic adaptor subunit [Serratia sp. ATCC 39006]WJV61658.1 biotin/lipoyl-binding protein [Pectobacteriaceae bacterium C52]WJV65934.1 biotin/lipoyl-binding protein [Pectobacteriaceae bacterium CE70]WJY09951.1 biotin/lipoyl-binding protein [Pectobacteriaceae bacterium C80]
MSELDCSRSEQVFARFIHLEHLARAAKTPETLAYTMVNDSQRLFGFRHVALVIGGRVRAVTGVSVPDPHAPFIAFIERACRQLVVRQKAAQATMIDAAWLDQQSQHDWQTLSAQEALWVPLTDGRGQLIGGLWYARDQPWQEAERLLAEQLADAYSHAWLALEPRKVWRPGLPRVKVLAGVVVLALVMMIPVRQSVLAPAEVVPLEGQVIAAPLDGVIAAFMVKPNQSVKQNDVLVRFDNTTLKAQADVAARALGVAEAELRTHSQRAFQDVESKSKLDLLSAQVEQKRAELAYAKDLLQRSEIHAERDGIAVFADADRWAGKPVRTGERLMELANPQQAELKIELDVGDAIHFPPSAEVALFLSSDPLQRHAASLERIAYEAAPTAYGTLAYRLDARFIGAPPRIGLRGTAKVYGEHVPLGVYLFRRPLAAVRKTLGI